MADLEAELDDPYAEGEGEWEEIEELMENDPPIQQASATADAEIEPRLGHLADNTEPAYLPPQEPNLEESDQDVSGPSYGDVADNSDGSDLVQVVHTDSEAMAFLNLEEPPSPISSTSSHPPELSNSTVPPVNIINKKATSGLSASSRNNESTSRNVRNTSRTPSPSGLPPSLHDPMGGVEGPMTPRNDAGPFVFDGSAGRIINLPLDTVADLGLTTETSSPRLQPQPQPQHEPPHETTHVPPHTS